MPKAKAAIEPWNAEALADALAYDLPQYWVLITPVECQALREGIVSTRLQIACTQLERELMAVKRYDAAVHVEE